MKTDWLSDVGDKIRADCERWKHHKNFYLTKAKEWPKSTPKFIQCCFCCHWMWIFGRHERLGWKNSRNSEQIEVAILLMISISFSNLTFSIVYKFIFWIWRCLNERLYLPGTVTSFLNEHYLTWITDIFLWSNESYILQMKYTWIEYYYDRNVSEIKMAMLGSTRLKNV